MAYSVNETIYSGFILRDNSGAAITGKSTVDFAVAEAYALSSPATVASLTITEVGGGEYAFRFSPTVEGQWAVHIQYTSGSFSWEGFDSFDVDAASSVTTPSGVVSTGVALKDIRATVARHCMDWVRLVATEPSSDTTVFIDSVNGYENDHHFRGSDLWFRSDAGTLDNRGRIVRVVDSSLSSASLTLGSGLSVAPFTGDEAWLYNIGGSGNRINTYDAVINDTIRSLGEQGFPVYSEDLSATWDRLIYWVDLPAAFTHVSSVHYQDIEANWFVVPSHGFELDLVNKRFALAPEYANLAHGYTVRINGKTNPSALVDDDDETDVDFEWLTQEAAAMLLLQARDQFRVNKGGMLKNNADALRGKAGPFNLIENMIRVR